MDENKPNHIEYKGRRYRLFFGASFIEEESSGYVDVNLDRPMMQEAKVLFPARDGNRIVQITVPAAQVNDMSTIVPRLEEVLEDYHQMLEKQSQPK